MLKLLLMRERERRMEEVGRTGKPNKLLVLHPKTSLAYVESLHMPLVQQVVFSADFQCANCQKRVANVISRMYVTDMESVVVNVLEKKVTLTYKNPKVATQRIAAICKKQPGRVAMFMRIFGLSWRRDD